MIKVFIADDHQLIREGIKSLLNFEGDISVTGEASGVFETIEKLKNTKCDVLILDINLPEKSGLEIISEIKNISPDIKILILSIYPEKSFAKRAIQAGASGYLTKDSAGDELCVAIKRIYSGKRYISQNFSNLLLDEIQFADGKLKQITLSNRELEILKFITEGKTQKFIANKLSISPNTVNTYRSRILKKLHLETTAELIHYAMVNKLFE